MIGFFGDPNPLMLLFDSITWLSQEIGNDFFLSDRMEKIGLFLELLDF